MLTSEACKLNENCRVVNENKNQKKQTRVATCTLCNNNFHAICINYHSKSETEFTEAIKSFTCQHCFQLVATLSEHFFKMVNKLFVDMCYKVEKLSNEVMS